MSMDSDLRHAHIIASREIGTTPMSGDLMADYAEAFVRAYAAKQAKRIAELENALLGERESRKASEVARESGMLWVVETIARLEHERGELIAVQYDKGEFYWYSWCSRSNNQIIDGGTAKSLVDYLRAQDEKQPSTTRMTLDEVRALPPISEERMQELRDIRDEDIDTSDIPDQTDALERGEYQLRLPEVEEERERYHVCSKCSYLFPKRGERITGRCKCKLPTDGGLFMMDAEGDMQEGEQP